MRLEEERDYPQIPRIAQIFAATGTNRKLTAE
jgi:hypothetical protein